MSMISSQRDTLLVMADALEEEYPSFAREVRRAADTIWELRNKLAGTVDQSERIAELEDENAKLRELTKAAWGCVNRHVSCDECRMVCCGCTLQSAMHELGIEVEE